MDAYTFSLYPLSWKCSQVGATGGHSKGCCDILICQRAPKQYRAVLRWIFNLCLTSLPRGGRYGLTIRARDVGRVYSTQQAARGYTTKGSEDAEQERTGDAGGSGGGAAPGPRIEGTQDARARRAPSYSFHNQLHTAVLPPWCYGRLSHMNAVCGRSSLYTLRAWPNRPRKLETPAAAVPLLTDYYLLPAVVAAWPTSQTPTPAACPSRKLLLFYTSCICAECRIETVLWYNQAPHKNQRKFCL